MYESCFWIEYLHSKIWISTSKNLKHGHNVLLDDLLLIGFSICEKFVEQTLIYDLRAKDTF